VIPTLINLKDNSNKGRPKVKRTLLKEWKRKRLSAKKWIT
jgi:hypothetical protein